MKEKIQQIPAGVIIAVAVVAVALAGFLGFRNFAPEKSTGSNASDYASHQKGYTSNGRGTNNMAAGYQSRSGYGGQGGPGGGYPGGNRQPGGYGQGGPGGGYPSSGGR